MLSSGVRESYMLSERAFLRLHSTTCINKCTLLYYQDPSPTMQSDQFFIDQDLAAKIDHTILRPTTVRADIDRICKEAEEYNFAAVCIPPCYVKQAVKNLDHTDINVCTVIGFPMGYSSRMMKVAAMGEAVSKGADELDVVVNIGAVKDARWKFVRKEIKQVSGFAKQNETLLKVIIETGLLTADEVVAVCELCAEFDVDFVKTSTGFNGPGASIDAVELMRNVLPKHIQIKASGGIRSQAEAEALIEAGADRLGCSRSIEIVTFSVQDDE